MGELIHNGTMPSEGLRKDLGRKPGQGWKLGMIGELRAPRLLIRNVGSQEKWG